MTSFGKATAQRTPMTLQMPTQTTSTTATMMMQPTTARFDASHVPETNGATRNIRPVDHAIMQRIHAKINSQMPELALAHRQGRLTPQQHEKVKSANYLGAF